MRHRGLFITGVVLLVIGVAGLIVINVSGLDERDFGTYSSAGQRIYYTGIGDNGAPIVRTMPNFGMMGYGAMLSASCVDCHAEDGKGGRVAGMMGGYFDAPDIRYSHLTTPHTDEGATAPGWTEGQVENAIRNGVDPDGQQLQAPMPRWDMTDNEMNEIIAYLKEL
jgi:cytochrome c oxidase subunit 2